MTSLTQTPVLVQVKTPVGFRYVLQAEDYLGFVVQRRYRRLPPPLPGAGESSLELGSWYEPYLHPYLHPDLVAAAGLDLSTLEAWLSAHPGEVFTHPQYAPLCLRWGVNAGDYHVQAHRPPPLPFFVTDRTPRPLPVTPYTVWASGRTYYRLEAADLAPGPAGWPASAGLQWHAGEGPDAGWYTWEEQVLGAVAAAAPTPRTVELRQPPLPQHRLQLYQAPGLLVEDLPLATAELAWASYQAAPAAGLERPSAGAQVYPRVVLVRVEAAGRLQPYAEKAVAPATCLATLTLPAPPYLVPHRAWAPPEEPLPQAVQWVVREVPVPSGCAV